MGFERLKTNALIMFFIDYYKLDSYISTTILTIKLYSSLKSKILKPPYDLDKHAMDHLIRAYFFLDLSVSCHKNLHLILSISFNTVQGTLYKDKA